MKPVKRICTAIALLLIVFSCNKEKSLELGGNIPAGGNQWQFTETVQFKGNMDTAYFQSLGSFQSLILEGVSTDSSQGVFFLQVIGTGASITTTTYSNPSVLFEYSVGGVAFYANDQNTPGQFSVTITKLDSANVSGTFTGLVKDALGNSKSITDGKFSAKLGGTSGSGGNTTPTTCKLSNIAYYDPNSNAPLAAITNFFNAGNQVTKVQVIDSTSTPKVLNEFNLTYTSSQVNVDSKQYFSVAPGGLISQFHGYLDPTDNTSPKVFFTYNYNSSGQLSQAKIYLDTLGGVLVLTESLQWSGVGNLTSATLQPVGTTEKTVIDYDYDLNTAVKGSLAVFPNSEIIIFQGAVNYGKNNNNALLATTRKDYDSTGALISSDVSNFGNYALDASGYVKNLTITGAPTVYNTDTKYVLSWKCF
jgi:hypothetical protein